MVAPRWVRNRCQPIAIRNVIFYLMNVLGRKETLGRSFDIGGPEVLSYHHLLAHTRNGAVCIATSSRCRFSR